MMGGKVLPQLIRVTYICRRWRDVAVGCPEFWSFIIASSPTTTAKQLELSKQAPLTVFCMISGDSSESDTTKWTSLRLVLNNLDRVQSMTLLIRSSIPAPTSFDSLYGTAHAPLLKSFSIHAIANLDDPPTREVAQKVGQLWDAPGLRHFACYGGKDPFDCTQATEHPVLRWRDTLTTFAWFPKTNHHDQLRGSAQMLLQVIRQLPHLQTLQLSFSPSYATEPIKPLSERARVQPISMPALRRLVLRGHLQSCFDILDHLALPHHLDQLSVMAQNAEPAYHVEATPLTDHLVELLSQGSETLHEPHATAIPITRSMRTLCIRSHNREVTSFEILASSKLLQPSIDERFPLRRGLHPVPFEGMYPDLELCLTLPTSITRRHFARLFQGTSLCDAEVLQVMGRAHCLGGEPMLAPLQSTWSLDVMSRLNNVHTLFIDSPVDPELLTQYLSPSMGGQNPQHNFPRLRHVYCTQIACEPLRQITSVLSHRESIDEDCGSKHNIDIHEHL